ncbi:hypothetical protein C0991_006401 [Blastosporella zonata]|nr:hypothetical protein C0991_006401 [Blastosporella zonata]
MTDYPQLGPTRTTRSQRLSRLPYPHHRPPSPYVPDTRRPPSPTLSSVSNISADTTTPAPPKKQKKQRLDNTDRKRICKYHEDHPNSRQEDIASQFGVERSTISKILKQKSKWLTASDHLADRVAKHRPSKFPEVEEELRRWVSSCSLPISDVSIRERAKQIARALCIPEEKFKASSGWVENFKTRAGIQKGLYQPSASGSGNARLIDTNVLSPLNPAFAASVEAMSPNQGDDEMDEADEDAEHDLVEHHQPYQQPPSPHVHPHHNLLPTPTASSSSHSPTLQYPDPPTLQYPDPSTDHHSSASRHSKQEYFQRPPTPDIDATVTLPQAEYHLDTLIRFFDDPRTGRGDLISPQERDVLDAIKIVLFQEGQGINAFVR